MELLKGSVAIVTGAGRGIGRAICRAFVANGAYVAAVDIDDASLQETAKGDTSNSENEHSGITPIVADTADPLQVSSAVESATRRIGPISIVVNNAGIMRTSSVLDLSLEEWREVFRVNLDGTLLVSQAAARRMVDNGMAGCIINVCSAAARKADPGHAAYSASKAAMLQLTRTLALELGPYGIRSNAILPGATETPMLKKVFDEVPGIREDLISRTVLGKLGEPEDQANAALFLASPLASHITGEYVVVSGGEFMNA